MDDLIAACPELGAILTQAAEVSAYLWDKGWAERNGGNLSVDVTEPLMASGSIPRSGPTGSFEFAYPGLARRFFLVTGSGRRFRDLARNAADNACILRLSEDGGGYQLVWGGLGSPDFRPTSEFPTHLRVHEYLRERRAPQTVCLHTHPTELIALTHLPDCRDEAALNDVLWRMHPEVKVTLPRGLGLVPYTLPGSERLARATVEAFSRGHEVAMWQMHGCVAKARQVPEAFDLIDTLNKAAQIALLCRSTGVEPVGLTAADLDELVEAFRLEE